MRLYNILVLFCELVLLYFSIFSVRVYFAIQNVLFFQTAPESLKAIVISYLMSVILCFSWVIPDRTPAKYRKITKLYWGLHEQKYEFYVESYRNRMVVMKAKKIIILKK